MKKLFVIEEMLLKDDWQRKLYLFCLWKQPNLLKYIFGIIWTWLLCEFHLISQSKADVKLWKYLKDVKDLDIKLAKFWSKNPVKINGVDDWNDSAWTSSLPEILFEQYAKKVGVEFLSPLKLSSDSKNKNSKNENLKQIDVLVWENYSKPLVYRQKLYTDKKKLFIVKCGHIFWISFVLTAMGIGVGTVSLYFGSSYFIMPMFLSYFKTPLIAVLNILPVMLLAYIMYFLFNRVWLSFFMSSFFAIGLSLVNYYKLMFRNDPLLVSDLIFFNESVDMAAKYPIHLNWKIIVVFTTIIVGVIVAFFIANGKISKNRYRLFGLIVCLLLGNYMFTHVYASSSYVKATENLDNVNRWSATQVYISRGFIYPFILSIFSSVEKVPDNYDKKQAIEELSKYTYENIPTEKKVNIISIMLEAFNDFSKYDQIQYDTDVYGYWNSLKEESYSGELVTNIFAGGTIDTERSFITGYTTLPNFRKDVPSYVRYFKEQGYYVEGSHPGYEWFYNRENVNHYLGFDNYYFFENHYKDFNGYIAKDDVTFKEIVHLFDENAFRNKPYFSFSVTYQNHGPYSTKPSTEQSFLHNQDYPTQEYNILNNYFAGIYDTQQQIKVMIDSLRDREEPVIVVIFGDHNPWLGDNNSVYTMLNINLDLKTENGFYNYYDTPYLIWANNAAKEALGKDFVGDGPQIGPYFLMNTIFELAGLKGNEYMQLSSDIMKQIDVIHRTSRYKENGVLTEKLSDTDQASIETYFKVQYYLRNTAKVLKTKE